MAVRRTCIDMNRECSEQWQALVSTGTCQSVTTYGSDGYGGLSKGSRRETKDRKIGVKWGGSKGTWYLLPLPCP